MAKTASNNCGQSAWSLKTNPRSTPPQSPDLLTAIQPLQLANEYLPNGEIQEVRGEGVVGAQPHLKPGQSFRYTSGTVIETPVGAMQGSYQMIADNGEEFDALIAPFSLAVPGLVH